jgi:hypothetical protein
VADASQIYPLGTYSIGSFAGVYDAGTGVFAKKFDIPGNASAGGYYLHVEARDRYFNFRESFIQIVIQ